MILDMQQAQMADGLVCFPSWPFSPEAVQSPVPNQYVREFIVLGGAMTPSPQVGGIVDDRESP